MEGQSELNLDWIQSQAKLVETLRVSGRELAVKPKIQQRILRSRVSHVVQSYLSVLANSISERLGKEVYASVGRPVFALNDKKAGLQFIRHGFLSLHLRVYQECLALMLPMELVHDLSPMILKQDTSSVLCPPTDEELTVINYFAAQLLVEEFARIGQRIYLTSSTVYSPSKHTPSKHLGISSQSYVHALTKRLLDNQAVVLPITLRLSGSAYQLAAVLDSELVRRICSYALLVPMTTEDLKLFQSVSVKCTVKAAVPNVSLSALLMAKPGDRIELSQNEISGQILLNNCVLDAKYREHEARIMPLVSERKIRVVLK